MLELAKTSTCMQLLELLGKTSAYMQLLELLEKTRRGIVAGANKTRLGSSLGKGSTKAVKGLSLIPMKRDSL